MTGRLHSMMDMSLISQNGNVVCEATAAVIEKTFTRTPIPVIVFCCFALEQEVECRFSCAAQLVVLPGQCVCLLIQPIFATSTAYKVM